MTTFEKRVSTVVRRIPCGKTMTYGGVARRAGFPRAARAVGNFLGNYDSKKTKMPCHRVVGVRGIGGYRWGISKKKALLQREGALARLKASVISQT
jgi:AraC family transcriptional regulator of adaptative response/methylated-DNA-[protein]-cysteine methyltransferase